MNTEGQRNKILWIAAIGGALLLALLLIPLILPTGSSEPSNPVLAPQTAAEAFDANSGNAAPVPAGGTGTGIGTENADPATDAGATTDLFGRDDETGTGGFDLGGKELFDLAWRLGLVIIIIGISVVGLRWWGRRSAGPKSNTGFVRVIDTLAISNGRTIHLVALGKRVITIGATDNQISFLNELNDDESKTVLDQHQRDTDVDLPGFADELLRLIRRDSNAPSSLNETVIGEEG